MKFIKGVLVTIVSTTIIMAWVYIASVIFLIPFELATSTVSFIFGP